MKRSSRKIGSSPDFAFIVHALSHEDFTRLPILSFMRHFPSNWSDSIDRMASKVPPFVYGHISGIVSEKSGDEIDGLIYAIPATPKVLKEMDPQVVYKKILQISEDARSRGAKILGLGAYTKIIGDQGVTVNRLSPIPVTTGNSLSASATIWALNEVIQKMRLIKRSPDSNKFMGTAMIIGATGSIGQVAAKLLASNFEKICLVAPNMGRIQELKAVLRQIAPGCEIITSMDGNEFAAQADAIVTATSAFEHKILDVMMLKPGAVVCDCSRPLDFDFEDAKKRPDVLIMESGEVILPGAPRFDCDLGLPENAVYACLAETAVLALERRFEAFTVGRGIEIEKVKSIYKMAKEHGVRLSSIYGHTGQISDREIGLIRQMALDKRGSISSHNYPHSAPI